MINELPKHDFVQKLDDAHTYPSLSTVVRKQPIPTLDSTICEFADHSTFPMRCHRSSLFPTGPVNFILIILDPKFSKQYILHNRIHLRDYHFLWKRGVTNIRTEFGEL